MYKQRTGGKTDGCATCYRSSRFTDASVTLLEFFRPETELLDRHNVGVVLLLRPVVTWGSKVQAKGPFLCVANTHLLFNPRRGDIKLAQLAIVLAEVHRVVRSCQATGEHCNIILSGDFNAVPHTPLYQLITTGELFFQGLPAWTVRHTPIILCLLVPVPYNDCQHPSDIRSRGSAVQLLPQTVCSSVARLSGNH